jgi:hypothetical protein
VYVLEMVCFEPIHAAVTVFFNRDLSDGRILLTLHMKRNAWKHITSEVYARYVKNELTLLTVRLTRGELCF